MIAPVLLRETGPQSSSLLRKRLQYCGEALQQDQCTWQRPDIAPRMLLRVRIRCQAGLGPQWWRVQGWGASCLLPCGLETSGWGLSTWLSSGQLMELVRACPPQAHTSRWP